jgi:SepF-like predicted cell division protein (DUF552 family)
MVFNKIRKVFSRSDDLDYEDVSVEDYIQIDPSQKRNDNKVAVRLFVLKQFDDVNRILNAIRDGYTIAIVDFKILKQKDAIELKRAVSKLKKTVDALEGSIAGHDNIVVITPPFAKIYKEVEEEAPTKKESDKYEVY